jgi:ribonuclease P protein component
MAAMLSLSTSMSERLRIPTAASFTTAHRLRHKPQFDLLYREGRRHSDALFLVLARPNALLHARLGLSISTKAVGNAVSRNRVKRVVRESFRLNLHRLPSVDVVVNGRVPVRAASNAQLMRSLEQLWDKLARHA